jgi:hypothetical protein
MGWNGGTEVMDAAIQLADAVAEHAYDLLGVDPSRVTLADVRENLDDRIRPHVRKVATLLEDKGWDSQEESDYAYRFAQEMLGYDDNAYEGWLRHKVTEATHDGTPEEIVTAAQALKTHTDKMKAGNT